MITESTAAQSTHEQKLLTAARVLRRGTILNGVVIVIALVAVLIAVTRILPDLFATLSSLMMFRYLGPDDTAVGIMLLVTLVNVSALLVTMVSVMAREAWSVPGLILLILANFAAIGIWGYTPGLVTVAVGIWALRHLLAVRGFLRTNPVMIRELRGRMRGARAFAVITIYLGLMSGFALLLYLIIGSVSEGNTAATGQIGRTLFLGVVGIELLLIIFIAPSFTSGAITGERERQTYDLVRTTLLTTPSFITGKLESSLGYILLLLLAAIPLQSIAFLFGGVSELELLLAFIILAVTAVTFGTFGIYFSATQPRTLPASVRSYTTIAAWSFIGPIVAAVLIALAQQTFFHGPNILQAPALEAFLSYASLLVTSLNPFATALTTQNLLVSRQIIGFYPVVLASDGSTIPMVSPWVVFTAIYQATASILIVLTVHRTRQIDFNA
jgi:hypothetical protein